MSDLNQLQNHFQDYLLQRYSSIHHDIMNTAKISALQRLDIYRDAYSSRLLEVLTQEYPVVHGLLGDTDFEKLGRDYIAAQPSTFQSLRWYGDQFPHFMEQSRAFSARPEMIEMAYFENALSMVFDACNNDVVSLEFMATIPFEEWPAMCFKLQDGFCRVSGYWNIIPLWNAVKAQEIPVLEKSADCIQTMIWRKNLEVLFCSLSVDEAYTIDAMQEGKTFGDICAGLCEWVAEEQVALHAATLLKRFILDELIAEISL